MESNVLECGVCTNIFSEQHCPRILPCSHTFCGRCIDGIISNHEKSCPLCREKFTASSANDLLFNRIAIDAAKQFSAIGKEQKSSSRGPMMSFKDFSNDFKEKFIKKAVANCKEATSQIAHDLRTLMRMKDSILQAKKVTVELKEMLKDVEIYNEDILYTIDENIKLMEDKSIVVQEAEKRFKDCEAKVKAAVDFASAGAIMDDSIDDINNFQAKVLEIKELLQENEKKACDIVKEMIRMQTDLRNVAEKIEKRVDEDLPKVIAVKTLKGQQRIGPINIGSKSRVFLGHLEEGDAQITSFAMKLELLVPKISRMVFVDLGAGNRFLGRIIIDIINEGNLAQNFLHMCAGDLGPSYANSSIFDIKCKGYPGENVGFGDYVVEDRTCTKPVLSGVDWFRESRRDIYKNTQGKEGDVRGWLSEGSTCSDVSRFYIVLREKSLWTPRDRFGVVLEGLQVLKDAILLYPNFKSIKIVNCGLVFYPF